MIRRLALLALLALSPGPGHAQVPAPRVEIEVGRSEVVPGQYLSLRLTVLVPTFMPKPPVLPGFEAPNLRVRLPGRATTPTSRSIDGEDWSGVTRRYLISPMVPGAFILPAQKVVVTYAPPQGGDPVMAEVITAPVSLTGTIPEGAEGLDPFIAATALELTEEITGEPTGLEPGESVRRSVTARIEGASPIVLPELLSASRIDGIAAYPDRPQVDEREERGRLSGTRRESVTLMAEGHADGEVAGVELDWFDLGSGTVRTARVEGFAISASGPPLAERLTDGETLPRLLAGGLAAILAGAFIAWGLRRLLPRAAARYREWRERRRAGKDWALAELKHAIVRRDHGAAVVLVALWAARPPRTEKAEADAVRMALTRVGERLYGRGEDPPSDADWRAVRVALDGAARVRQHEPRGALPPLNPSEVA